MGQILVINYQSLKQPQPIEALIFNRYQSIQLTTNQSLELHYHFSQSLLMSELSKFINLVIQFGQKLQSTLNKKYKPFIRSICNLQQLAKRIDPQNIFLTHELIIFKLGLQAKSTKSIEVSLFYLQKFFGNKFVDLSLPNYCEEFEIEDTTVRKKENIVAKGQIRNQLLRLLEPLIHFKSTEINILLLKVYEYLITEPIAPMLIELNLATPNTQIGQKILFNYYSYRFYIFQQVYTFTQKQFRSINPLSIRNQKINQEIQAAFVNHEALLDLVHKYVGEMVATVAHIGGKYGLCVICREPADYYCKITKASLCGAECKKRHLELAQKQYKLYYQATQLWKEIAQSFEYLLQTLSKRQSSPILNVFVGLLQKIHLFMIVKPQFRSLIGKYVTGIVHMAVSYKDQQTFEIVYNLIAVLCRYWMVESVTSLEYFFKECALKLIQDKRPSFKLLIALFKALAKIFEYGKTTIQLYINFDCEPNKTNILQRILFELSKICQDKFGSTMYYNKHQKIAIKNSALSLLTIMSKGLNQYRLLYPQTLNIEPQILGIKQRKINLQKFVSKFNEHWLQGLKMLYNMNVVGLDSQQQIVEILLTTKGLRKQKIEQMLVNQTGREYMDILFERLIQVGPFMGLIEMFRLVPLKKSSVLLKHYSDFVLTKMITAKQDQNDQKQQYSVTKWVGFLVTNYTLKELQKWLYMQGIKINGSIDHAYMKCQETKSEVTLGAHKTFFRHCISESYIKVFSAQLSLLQIPVLYLLQTTYPHDKIFQLVTELIPTCPVANWLSLCLKNVDLEKIKSGKYSLEDHTLIVGCLKECKKHAEYIHEWGSVLQFVCKLYKVMTAEDSHFKKLSVTTQSLILQEPIRIREELSILELEEYLLMIGENSVSNFANFICAMLHLSEEELQKENVFFLQKTFEILQQNLPKFVKNFQAINEQFHALLSRIAKHNLSLQSSNKPTIPSIMSISHTGQLSKAPKTPYSSQTLIYIADMLKQLFVKILKQLPTIKLPNQSQERHEMIEQSFFKLFALILGCENRQASDFVMNSLSMIVMVHFELKPQTWSYLVLEILKQHCKTYRQQVLTVVQKILKEKLTNCQHLEFELVNLAIDLVDDKQVKLSIESIHLLKDFVDLMVREVEEESRIVEEKMKQKLSNQNDIKKQHKRIEKEENMVEKQRETKQGTERPQSTEQVKIQQSQSSQPPKQAQKEISSSSQSSSQQSQLLTQSPKKLKQYLFLIISNMIEFISFQCHQGAIQILFILLKTRLTHLEPSSLLFTPHEIDLFISKIFKKLQSLPKEMLARGEKIMNESLFWSVRNGNFGIVKNLEECIVDKYSAMSHTAMKCIKTFISMTNPKKPEDWNPIEETLVKILGNTHLSDVRTKQSANTKDINLEELIMQGKGIDPQHKSLLPLTELSNKLVIQRMAVQVLPNDVKIIDELLKIYRETLSFNDDIYLRCLLWRQGLGGSNTENPPDILSLEELISYRIISTYYWSKEYQKIADFTLDIIERYCQASKRWQTLQSHSQEMQSQASDQTYELYCLCRDYWQKRRQPLKVIINYMLPKLPKICKDYLHKEKLLSGIIEGMKFCEERAAYVETVRMMTLVR